MKKNDLEYFKQLLLTMRARVNGDIDQLSQEALRSSQGGTGNLSSVPIHMADLGSDNYEQEFTLSLLENQEVALREIQAALNRIAVGTFGYCEECNKPIPKERLKAIPYTRYCVDCARKLEKKS
ncbi:MAG: transcriptional regulator [Gemmataceae bacterium]